MPKEILLYGEIYSHSSVEFINAINELPDSEDLVVRVNTGGGSPEYGFGMAAKFQEFKGNKLVKVDGKAHSTGFFFLAYADQVESLDVSEFLLHRAAYPDWFESSEYFTSELKANLERVNKSLRSAVEAKIDVAKFEELKGVKLKDIFSPDARIEVILTAKEAKQIGLINKINKLTPTKKAQIDARIVEMAANYIPTQETKKPIEAKKEITNNNNQNNNKMTKDELKANHPDVYSQVFNAGSESGITAEKDRVGSWMVFVDADAKAVTAGIAEGKQLSATSMAELNRKAVSAAALTASEAENAPVVPTEAPAVIEATETEAFDKELANILKTK